MPGRQIFVQNQGQEREWRLGSPAGTTNQLGRLTGLASLRFSYEDTFPRGTTRRVVFRSVLLRLMAGGTAATVCSARNNSTDRLQASPLQPRQRSHAALPSTCMKELHSNTL